MCKLLTGTGESSPLRCHKGNNKTALSLFFLSFFFFFLAGNQVTVLCWRHKCSFPGVNGLTKLHLTLKPNKDMLAGQMRHLTKRILGLYFLLSHSPLCSQILQPLRAPHPHTQTHSTPTVHSTLRNYRSGSRVEVEQTGSVYCLPDSTYRNGVHVAAIIFRCRMRSCCIGYTTVS